MADTSIPRVALGATTLNRKWFLDVDTTPTSTATWVGVFGMTEFKPGLDTTTQDTSDFASAWKGTQNTALAWKLEGKVKRAPTAASALAYDPGQEYLRAQAALVGVAGRTHVRWYEMEPSGPRVEAYEGYGTVTWTEDGGGQDAISMVSLVINGDGARTAITHPQPAVPYITSITPTGRAVAGLVTINGTNLTGATAISWGGTAATVFNVISDTQVSCVIPGTSGVKSVTITTPQGTSAGFSYTVA